jgi:tetratricopeptide (TPR) repeat protein
VLRQVLQAGWVEGAEPRFRKARDALEQAVALRADYAEAMAYLALAMILAGEDLDRAVTLIQGARRLLPGRDDYARIEAEGLAKQGKYPEARSLLGRVMARSRSDPFRAAVRGQLAQIVELEQAKQGRATEERTSLTPILRKLEPGERRVFGSFEAIDCEGGTAVLQLVAEGRTLRFLIRDWEQAQFISYREDVSGAIQCGPRPAPLAVLLTWRPVRAGTPAGDRFAGELVALEIVPQGYVPP